MATKNIGYHDIYCYSFIENPFEARLKFKHCELLQNGQTHTNIFCVFDAKS